MDWNHQLDQSWIRWLSVFFTALIPHGWQSPWHKSPFDCFFWVGLCFGLYWLFANNKRPKKKEVCCTDDEVVLCWCLCAGFATSQEGNSEFAEGTPKALFFVNITHLSCFFVATLIVVGNPRTYPLQSHKLVQVFWAMLKTFMPSLYTDWLQGSLYWPNIILLYLGSSFNPRSTTNIQGELVTAHLGADMIQVTKRYSQEGILRSIEHSLPTIFSWWFQIGWWFQKYFLCSPLLREVIQFDKYDSKGLKPPASKPCVGNPFGSYALKKLGKTMHPQYWRLAKIGVWYTTNCKKNAKCHMFFGTWCLVVVLVLHISKINTFDGNGCQQLRKK